MELSNAWVEAVTFRLTQPRPAQNKNRYKKADWESHRPRLAVLYQEHTLPEVMKIMAEELDFRHT